MGPGRLSQNADLHSSEISSANLSSSFNSCIQGTQDFTVGRNVTMNFHGLASADPNLQTTASSVCTTSAVAPYCQPNMVFAQVLDSAQNQVFRLTHNSGFPQEQPPEALHQQYISIPECDADTRAQRSRIRYLASSTANAELEGTPSEDGNEKQGTANDNQGKRNVSPSKSPKAVDIAEYAKIKVCFKLFLYCHRCYKFSFIASKIIYLKTKKTLSYGK